MARIVIIGAGECGARAAFALREKGFSGTIALVGTEPIAPYERPPLSKASLTEMGEPKFVAAPERYADHGIDLLIATTATAIDPETRSVSLSDGAVLPYDKLLLATGATARPFPGLAETKGRIRSLRTHADALALRNALRPGCHLAIVGGGFIGLELAATARRLGA